jgi:hypothetical protein
MPVRVATSLKVWLGDSALNERITASPRANDWTNESPGAALVEASGGMLSEYPVGAVFVMRTIVRIPNKASHR